MSRDNGLPTQRHTNAKQAVGVSIGAMHAMAVCLSLRGRRCATFYFNTFATRAQTVADVPCLTWVMGQTN